MSEEFYERLPDRFASATATYDGHEDIQMTAVGAVIAIGIGLLLAPLLPFVIVILGIGALANRL